MEVVCQGPHFMFSCNDAEKHEAQCAIDFFVRVWNTVRTLHFIASYQRTSFHIFNACGEVKRTPHYAMTKQ